jgi:hypothetical protein
VGTRQERRALLASIAFRSNETQELGIWGFEALSKSHGGATTRSRCNRMEFMENATSGYRVSWQGGFERAARGVYRHSSANPSPWGFLGLARRGF